MIPCYCRCGDLLSLEEARTELAIYSILEDRKAVKYYIGQINKWREKKNAKRRHICKSPRRQPVRPS